MAVLLRNLPDVLLQVVGQSRPWVSSQNPAATLRLPAVHPNIQVMACVIDDGSMPIQTRLLATQRLKDIGVKLRERRHRIERVLGQFVDSS